MPHQARVLKFGWRHGHAISPAVQLRAEAWGGDTSCLVAKTGGVLSAAASVCFLNTELNHSLFVLLG